MRSTRNAKWTERTLSCAIGARAPAIGSARSLFATLSRWCRFPAIDCEDVAVRMRVLNGRLFLDALEATYLGPIYKADAPDTLETVTVERKVCWRRSGRRRLSGVGRQRAAPALSAATPGLSAFVMRKTKPGIANRWRRHVG